MTSTLVAPVIAMVASAGGLAALSTVLGSLPADFPASVVVLQHLEPTKPSELARLLQHSCPLDVRPARDGDDLLPGSVLVAPSGMHTLITPARTVSLVESGSFPPSRPSADLMLTTLALAVESAAIAVVLTGGGQDGATGATAIHKHGGVVITTDAQTSKSFAMPSATIERDGIDPMVLPLELIAEGLVRLVLSGSTR